MLKVKRTPIEDSLYIQFYRNEIISKTEWVSSRISIDLTWDEKPVGMTILKVSDGWPLDDKIIDTYRLRGFLDDFTTVKKAFFGNEPFKFPKLKIAK